MCRVWQAQILDANCHASLSEHSSDVNKVIRYENANLWTCSLLLIFFFFFCIASSDYLLSAAFTILNSCQNRENK